MPSTPLQQRRLRVRIIRRRVLGAATAIFLASTGGIFVQLVSGHDPALARGSHTTTTQASISGASVASGSSPSNSSSTTSSSASSGGAGSSSSSSGSGTAAPVTTSQS
jgi:hypothetical protein